MSPPPTRLDPGLDCEVQPLNACTSCGVCCFSMLETYIRVTGDDWSRFGDEAEHFAHFIEHRAYMKMEHGHCAALSVERGPGGQRLFFCRLYSQRPQICRDLERGSPACEGERTMKSERVAQATPLA